MKLYELKPTQYKFIKVRNKAYHTDNTEVRLISNSVSLEELLTSFEEFLKACGFSLDGKYIALMDYDEEVKNNE